MKTTFKIIDGNLHEYDSNENLIHRKSSDGYEWWSEYDSNGKEIHLKDSNGYEIWREYDSDGNEIHFKDSDGYESWREYDSHGDLTHYKNSNGEEKWYDSHGNSITKEQFDKLQASCDGKIIEVDGKKYRLTLI